MGSLKEPSVKQFQTENVNIFEEEKHFFYSKKGIRKKINIINLSSCLSESKTTKFKKSSLLKILRSIHKGP